MSHRGIFDLSSNHGDATSGNVSFESHNQSKSIKSSNQSATKSYLFKSHLPQKLKPKALPNISVGTLGPRFVP